MRVAIVFVVVDDDDDVTTPIVEIVDSSLFMIRSTLLINCFQFSSFTKSRIYCLFFLHVPQVVRLLFLFLFLLLLLCKNVSCWGRGGNSLATTRLLNPSGVKLLILAGSLSQDSSSTECVSIDCPYNKGGNIHFVGM